MSQLKLRVLNAIFIWFGRLGPAGRLRIGAVLGWLTLKLAKPRVRIVRKNLELCFPEQPVAVREQWLREHFRALCQSIVDRGVLWYGTRQAVLDMVTESGGEYINKLVAERRRVILLSPHFLGMDAAGTRLTMHVPAAACMYTAPGDPTLDAIMRGGRTRFGEVHLISRKEGVRDLIRHLRNYLPIYYLPDMDFGRTGSTFAPFFGIPAATLLATAQLARKWDAAVVPILPTMNLQTGTYHVDVLPPLPNFPGDDTLEEATARLNRELESWVRRCPAQYYWVHRRFKTRPPGEPKIY